jgi:hypothetical protein
MPFLTTCLTLLWPVAQSGNSAEAARIVTGVKEDPPTSGPSQFSSQSNLVLEFAGSNPAEAAGFFCI